MSQWCPSCFGELSSDGTCRHCAGEKIDSQSIDLPSGTFIDSRYIVGRVLGRGGFGITYLGWQQLPGRRVAIKEYLPQTVAVRATDGKVIPSSRSAEPEFRQGLAAFAEEADRLARFHGHPNIVSVFEFVYANGTAYMVMEYCPGQTAIDYLNTYGGRVSYDDAVAIMAPVLDALDVLHAQNVYHRDISPDNILLTEQGVKLIDFGAARAALRDRSISFSTILKMDYAPPEQYSRKGNQGPWTDVYAAAATMYHLLTGSPPPPAMDRQVSDEIEPPSAKGAQLPPHGDQAIMAALSMEVSQRTQTAHRLRAALEAGARREPAPVVHPSPITEPSPPLQPVSPHLPRLGGTRTGIWIAAAILLTVVPALGLGIWWTSRPPRIVTFVAQPSSVSPGTQVELRWETTGTRQVEIRSSDPAEARKTGLGAEGRISVSPRKNTAYTLTAAGRSAAVSDTKMVFVDEPIAADVPAAPQPGGAAPPRQAGGGTAAEPQPAQRDRVQEAREVLQGGLVKQVADLGFTEEATVAGEFETGQQQYWDVELLGQRDYIFAAAADRDTQNVDLVLHRDDGAEVTRDDASDATPIVRIETAAAGKYRLMVKMAACGSSRCTAFVVRFAKPLQ